MSDDLPVGWAVPKLDELVSFALGGDWGKDPDEPGGGFARVRVVRGTEFKSWREERGSTAAIRCIKTSSLEKRRLQKGDIILEVSGGGPNQPVGRTVLIDDETLRRTDAPLVCSNFFRLLRLKHGVYAPYVNQFLNYAYAQGKFNEFQTETTNLRNLNVTDFLERTEVWLAPRAEQQRIVVKLDNLLAKADACKRRLQKIPALLKRFRQSVLAAACSGRLTADWREENSSIAPTRFLYATASDHTQASADEFAELPETWRLVILDSLLQPGRGISYGILKPGIHDPTGVRLLKSQQVRDGTMDLSEDFRITRKLDEEYARTKLQGGEVLLNLVGASIGRSAIAPAGLRGANVSRAVAVIPVVKEIAAWVQLNLRGPVGQKLIQSKTGGSAQPVLNLSEVRTLSIPMPPLPEQQEIVRRVERLFALADQVEARYTQAKTHFDKIKSSLLAKAFRGKLVPTEAELARREGRDYEDAHSLLERLSAGNDSAKPAHIKRKLVGRQRHRRAVPTKER